MVTCVSVAAASASGRSFPKQPECPLPNTLRTSRCVLDKDECATVLAWLTQSGVIKPPVVSPAPASRTSSPRPPTPIAVPRRSPAAVARRLGGVFVASVVSVQ